MNQFTQRRKSVLCRLKLHPPLNGGSLKFDAASKNAISDGVLEAVSSLLKPLRIGIAHRPESTIRYLVMRPKAPLSRGETAYFIYQNKSNSCAVDYVGETRKRLQTRVTEHMRSVRRLDPQSLVDEHFADSGHTLAFQNAEILGRGIDRVAREIIEA
ncbi:unnamed protein product [Dibothriocephalus latus]|uniref:GIY-YIG domain-containing protein n=1 Tax=Dibothriocephalus latus TaxID=60516 RepID=A0A3P7N6E3_DIBLA|nr:unnamed protein product [Dibothriocephalus latus]